MNQNVFVRKSGACDSGGQIKVSGKVFLLQHPMAEGLKKQDNRGRNKGDQPQPHPYVGTITFNEQLTPIKIAFIHS